MTSKPKAYSYLRFSTPEQLKGDSHRRQTKLAEDYARAHGLDLDTKLTFQDLGVSAYRGRNAEAGRLSEFLEAVSEGLIKQGSVLLVENLDRISRQTARKAVRTLEDIIEMGVDVVTLSDGKRWTRDGLDGMDFLWAIMLFARSNEESVTKGRRVRAAWDNKRAKASERPLTALTPGWIKLDRENGKLVLVDDRASVVRRIFKLTIDGVGQHAIARMLNAEGIEPFGSGRQWHRSYIAKLLANEAVIGTLTPHVIAHPNGQRVREAQSPVPGYYPAAVSYEDWEAIRAKDGLRGPKPKAENAIRNPLAGMVRCSLCGGSMTRVNKGKKSVPSYVCSAAKTGTGCQYYAVRQRDVEEAIAREASTIVTGYPDPDTAIEAQSAELVRQLDTVEMEIGQLIDLLIAGPSAALRERLADAEAIKIEIEQKLSGIELSPIPARREKALTELEAGFISRETMSTLFTKAVLDPLEGSISLHWRHQPEDAVDVQFRWPAEIS